MGKGSGTRGGSAVDLPSAGRPRIGTFRGPVLRGRVSAPKKLAKIVKRAGRLQRGRG